MSLLHCARLATPGALGLLLAGTPALAQDSTRPTYPYGPEMMNWYGPAWGFSHLIFWLVLLAALALGVIWLTRTVANTPRTASRDAALDTLNTRYARGEIDRDDYLQRKQDLLN